jgi:DNA-binding transcriptional LysR family regulator
MNLRQIEHFVAIVEHGGYRAAADHLGITQPALSKTIAGLEADLGVTLLTRDRGKATDVTVFGRVVYERGLRLIEDLDQTRRSVELLRDGYAGDVRIGFGAAMPAHRIARISCALQAKLPQSMIHIRSGLQHELIPKLRSGDLDFLILGGINPDNHGDLSARLLWSDPFKVFMGCAHTLSQYAVYDRSWASDWIWLSSERLVSADDNAARYLGHDARTVAPSKFDVFDPAVIAEILNREQSLSAWPSRSFEKEVQSGVLHALEVPPLDGKPWTSETHLVHSRGVLMAPAVQSAWRLIQTLDFSTDLSLDG